MLALSFGQEVGWRSGVIIGLFVAAVVLLAVFVLHERRVAQPIVDFSLFRNRLFTAAITSTFLCFLSLFAVMFLMPFYLEELLALPVGWREAQGGSPRPEWS
jgi:predicted MFS family arabinose efflux permease